MNSTSDQFAVSQTPYHTHNGMDSQRIPFIGLSDVPMSYYQKAGYAVVVDAQENGLDFVQSVGSYADSIVNTAGTVTLVNDSASPGNSEYYGTNGAGTKGFYALPAATPGGSSTSMQYNNGGAFAGDGNFTYNGTKITVAAGVDAEFNGYLKLPVGTNVYP